MIFSTDFKSQISNKTIFIAFFQLFICPVISLAQDTIVVKPCRFVGDTIHLSEKIKYGLLPEIPTNEFVYCRYLSIKRKVVVVQARMKDGSDLVIPYTFESLFNDGHKISSKYVVPKNETKTGNEFVTEPKSLATNATIGSKTTRKSIRLKLTDQDDNKSYYFKEGNKIHFRLINDEHLMQRKFGDKVYNNSLLIKGRIIKILNAGTPSIKIKLFDFGETEKIIPISDFKEVSNYDLNNLLMDKFFAGGLILYGGPFLVFPFVMGVPELIPLFIVGVGLEYLGIKKLIKWRHSFDLTGNSTIEISYK